MLPRKASIDDLVGPNAAATLPSYDETALCSAAFRVMRSMVNGWLRDVSLHRNIFSDFQIVHFYRWVRSSNALLYDPALRRALNNLMRKLFLQIIAEFKRLGADVIHADFNRIIINTQKRSIVDAISYVDYIVQNIRNKELFHSVHLSYTQCWEFLLWMDPANFSGVRGRLPKDMNPGGGDNEEPAERNTTIRNNDDEDDDNADEVVVVADGEGGAAEEEIALDMNWNIGEQISEQAHCREHFENVVQAFMEALAERCLPEKAIELISYRAFDAVQRMHRDNATGKSSPALDFVNAVCKILAINRNIDEEVQSLRRNMLRLIGVGEFSDTAEWTDRQNTFVLNEVICKACNHCRDLDLVKDKHKAMKDGV